MTLPPDEEAMQIVFKGWNEWKRRFTRMLVEYKKAPDKETERAIVKAFMERVEVPRWSTIKTDLLAAVAPAIKGIDAMARQVIDHLVDKMPIS